MVSIPDRKHQQFKINPRNAARHGGTVLALALFLLSLGLVGAIRPNDGASALTAHDPTDTVNVPGCDGQAECFAFTIDTTLDVNGGHTGTSTTFAIPVSGYVNGTFTHPYNWIVNCGDGSSDQLFSGTGSSYDNGINCNYSTPGQYQITIRPNDAASPGWLDAFGFYGAPTGAGASAIANTDMFYSIDTPLPNLGRTKGATYRFAYMFWSAQNAIGIPDNLFSNIVTTGDISFSNMFYQTFYRFAWFNKNPAGAIIPAGLFDALDTSSGTDFSGMFNQTFNSYAYNTTLSANVIPAGLFDFIDTSSGVNFSRMFQSTFVSIARNTDYPPLDVGGTIPAGLFDRLDTINGKDFSNMFNGTFSYFAYTSMAGTVPTDLFSKIDTTNGTMLAGMFFQTFQNYANRTADFSINGSTIINLTQTFRNPYSTKNTTTDSGPSTSPTVNAGDVVVPTYNGGDRTITAPTGVYADYNWYRTDGTSCAVAYPTLDCGAQTADQLVTFPVSDEWTPETSTEKGNVTFYGAATTVTASFDPNGGAGPDLDDQIVGAGSIINQPANPTYDNFTFAGWFSDAALTTPWDFATDVVTEDTTLYAKWIAETTPPFRPQPPFEPPVEPSVVPGVPDTGLDCFFLKQTF